MTYDEIWQRTVAYASAVKAQDPAAQVFGQGHLGLLDLFGSAADNCVDGSDREAHEGKPFVKWYLGKVCEYQAQNGVRLVDVLDLHYYPQGQGVVDFSDPPNGSETATVSARRLRSLKELYDANWESESWSCRSRQRSNLALQPPQFDSARARLDRRGMPRHAPCHH